MTLWNSITKVINRIKDFTLKTWIKIGILCVLIIGSICLRISNANGIVILLTTLFEVQTNITRFVEFVHDQGFIGIRTVYILL